MLCFPRCVSVCVCAWPATCADGAGGTGRNGRRDRVERAPWFPPRPAAVRRRSKGCADRPSRPRCVFSPAAPILQKGLKRKSAAVASEEVVDAARQWIEKLSVKNGTYPPDSYPNPGTPRYLRSKERKTQLTHHASSVGVPQRAARSERVPRRIRSRELRGSDAAKGRQAAQGPCFRLVGWLSVLTPTDWPAWVSLLPQRAGGLLKKWKEVLMNDEAANQVILTAAAGTKRKAVGRS